MASDLLNLSLAGPEILLAAASLVLLLLGVFLGDRHFRKVAWLCVLALIGAILLTAWGAGNGTAFDGAFVVDAFARFAKILVFAAAAIAIPMALDYAEREGMARCEMPVLILLASLGMGMMISANDLIALYVGLELQSLSLYVLAAMQRSNLRSSEAGLKYFVLGALSSGLLLYGASLIYGATGATNFDDLATAILGPSVDLVLLTGLVFLMAGLAFKISAVPFHMWAPDVYEGAPTPITAFFAAAPKVAALALIARVLLVPFAAMPSAWQDILSFVAIASMIFGAVAAINQSNIKRLMAYSSIGNIGYALIGLIAGDAAGLSGMLVYMTIYVVMTLGAFGVILAMRREGRMVEAIADLAGLSRSQPALAYALAIFMFSMAGIPPLAGFFGKLAVFMAAISAGFYGLAVIGVLASVVGAFYYMRIVRVMFFDPPVGAFAPVAPILRLILIVSGVAILGGILVFPPLQEAARMAANALIPG